MIDYLQQLFNGNGWFEWLGVVTGLLCVWLAAKNNIWNWPIAIVNVLIYVFIFKESKLYSDMALQFYLLAMNAYGWYYWLKGGHKAQPKPISKLKQKNWLLILLLVVCFTVVLGYTLFKKTDASFPFIDSFCTACSLVAQILMARRILDNWLLWLLVNIIYVAVYFAKSLYPTGLMYGLYIYMAAKGYIEWANIYREKNEENSHCRP